MTNTTESTGLAQVIEFEWQKKGETCWHLTHGKHNAHVHPSLSGGEGKWDAFVNSKMLDETFPSKEDAIQAATFNLIGQIKREVVESEEINQDVNNIYEVAKNYQFDPKLFDALDSIDWTADVGGITGVLEFNGEKHEVSVIPKSVLTPTGTWCVTIDGLTVAGNLQDIRAGLRKFVKYCFHRFGKPLDKEPPKSPLDIIQRIMSGDIQIINDEAEAASEPNELDELKERLENQEAVIKEYKQAIDRLVQENHVKDSAITRLINAHTMVLPAETKAVAIERAIKNGKLAQSLSTGESELNEFMMVASDLDVMTFLKSYDPEGTLIAREPGSFSRIKIALQGVLNTMNRGRIFRMVPKTQSAKELANAGK